MVGDARLNSPLLVDNLFPEAYFYLKFQLLGKLERVGNKFERGKGI